METEVEGEGKKKKGRGEPSLLVGRVQWPHRGLGGGWGSPTGWAESPLEHTPSFTHACAHAHMHGWLHRKNGKHWPNASWETHSDTDPEALGAPWISSLGSC